MTKKPDILRDVLEEIEVLRIKKQDEVRERPHPLLKRFTQQELTDEACPTYKNLLVGRSQRIPGRQMLMQIADYLECSLAQRNTLLLAARYLPENLELTGNALRLALEQGQRLMETLPYPAMLVTHTLEITAVNELFQRCFAFPPLNALSHVQRHVLPSILRADSSMRIRSTFSDQATQAWQAGVFRCIQLFRQSNRLYQFEPWYQDLIEQFSTIADFRFYWEQAPATLDQYQEIPKLLLGQDAATGAWLPMRIQQVRISVCSHMYPCLMALFPLDDAARAVFASLNNAGETALSAASLR